MLLSQIKEREYRFKLALRIGLPIFALIFALISTTFINSYESLHSSFFITLILLLTFSIYFIFFLIYKGFDTKITETVTGVFSREYLYAYLKKEIQKENNYTLMLLSVDNLSDINRKYGLKNGDKVLHEVIQYISSYFVEKKITNFPLGHIKGGDYLIGLPDTKENYNTTLELLCLKSSEFKVDEIEINISGAITDTSYSNNLDYLIENLFEIQSNNRDKRNLDNQEVMNPSDLESCVIKAINEESVSLMTQNVYENDKIVMKECFAKLKSLNSKVLHPKSYMKVVNKLGLRADYDFLILQKSISSCMDEFDKMFSVLIDPASLRNNNFLNKTKDLFENNPSVKNRIVFMISENEYYSHTNRFNAILKSLQKEGVKICIDRVGSLHTSFLYLRELDIDMIRFDSFYSKNIQKNKSIIDGFVTIAKEKNLKTWFKLLEDDKAKNLAVNMKIDFLQGKILAELTSNGN